MSAEPVLLSTSNVPILSVIAPHGASLPSNSTESMINPILTLVDPSGNPSVESGTSQPIKENEVDNFNPQHLNLPRSNVSKLMKHSLPLDAKISNDSKLLISKCLSEFLSFVTSEANEKVLNEDRKTINGVDLIWSFKKLGFDGYSDCLKVYLVKFRTVANETGKKNIRARAEDGEDLEETREDEYEEGGGVQVQEADESEAQYQSTTSRKRQKTVDRRKQS